MEYDFSNYLNFNESDLFPINFTDLFSEYFGSYDNQTFPFLPTNLSHYYYETPSIGNETDTFLPTNFSHYFYHGSGDEIGNETLLSSTPRVTTTTTPTPTRTFFTFPGVGFPFTQSTILSEESSSSSAVTTGASSSSATTTMLPLSSTTMSTATQSSTTTAYSSQQTPGVSQIFLEGQVFCNLEAENCPEDTVVSCGPCLGPAGAFAFFVVLIALAILISSVVKIVRQLLGTSPATKVRDRVHVSHAVANLLTGILLLVVAIYNFAWSITSTRPQLYSRANELHSSAGAKVGGMFLLLCYTAPLYHWLYVASHNLFGVLSPKQHRALRLGTVYAGLAVVWIAAIFVAVLPAWIPSSFSFVYFKPTFLFTLSGSRSFSSTPSHTSVIIYGILVFLLPYLTAVGLIIAALVLLKKHELTPDAKDREAARTALIQILVYTVALLPLVVVLLIEFSDSGKHNAVAHTVSFYLSTLHSLCSYIVDYFRDKSSESKLERRLQEMERIQ